MNPLAATRPFVPTIALALAAVTIAGALGVSLGLHSWLLVLGLSAVVGAAAGGAHLFWVRRNAAPPPAKGRPRLRVIHGGKAAATYDLAKDQSTDNQRYLM
jgi:hypothetical protein